MKKELRVQRPKKLTSEPAKREEGRNRREMTLGDANEK